MGIPAQKYIKEQYVPDGFEVLNEGTLQHGDKIWSTSEGVWFDIETFDEYIGDDVKNFYRICRNQTK